MLNKKGKDLLLNRKEAAKYIGFSPGSLATWACTKRHDLKPRKIAGRAYYELAVLDKFLEGQLIG
ncbi:helix-turn-helix domain-containing protein [Hufsiella ginkgonis]|uniref:DNA-binding protein n=1 Tax=Hufsiella ginkgonis TaxID=2695274 RepID=A0A7K1Y108_9SPHI|nr:helix-turn-helix domain-containing protein [Hufsiella ginkgonis]MXV16892.1 DNA-binding protein [Hufsiella ginkgonis]